MTLHQNLINGEWAGGDAIANINPSNTNEVVGQYARATAEDTLNAIAAAKAAFPAWSRSGILERHAILRKTADEIIARKEELGRLLSREEGKTLPEGIGETIRAAQIFDFFAGEALRLAGEVLPSARPNIGVEITREPVGVVGIITPWNFPIAIPAWKIAPALCLRQHRRVQAGRTRARLLLGDRRHPAPRRPAEGRAQPRHGQGLGRRPDDARQPGCRRPSPSPARSAPASASLPPRSSIMRKFQLEMGGKNPFVVLDDADLNVAVEAAVNCAFFSTGQRCTASSRLIVTEGIHDKFVAAMTERLKSAGRRRCVEGGHPYRPGGRCRASSSRIPTTSTSAEGRRQARLRRRAAEPRNAGLLPAAGAVYRSDQPDAHFARRDLRPGRQCDPRQGLRGGARIPPTTRRSACRPALPRPA